MSATTMASSSISNLEEPQSPTYPLPVAYLNYNAAYIRRWIDGIHSSSKSHSNSSSRPVSTSRLRSASDPDSSRRSIILRGHTRTIGIMDEQRPLRRSERTAPSAKPVPSRPFLPPTDISRSSSRASSPAKQSRRALLSASSSNVAALSEDIASSATLFQKQLTISVPSSDKSIKPGQPTPIKRLGDLWKWGVLYQNVDQLEEEPKDIVGLLDSLDRASRQEGIIPQEVYTSLAGRGSRGITETMIQENPPPTGKYSHSVERQMLKSIVDTHHGFVREGYDEAGWNGKIHLPLLNLAFEAGPEMVDVEVLDVTRAKIPKSLLPKFLDSICQDSRSEGKMVGFSVNLILCEKKYSPSTLERFFTSLPPGQRTLNQSMYSPHTKSPAAIAIGTKVNDRKEPLIQLAIWALAWRENLLTKFPCASIPSLPLIVAKTDGWKLGFLVPKSHGNIHSILYEHSTYIGNTNSLTAIYQLLETLRIIHQWIQDTYEPWFAESVWPLILRATEDHE